MSNTAGRSVPAGFPPQPSRGTVRGLASEIAEREGGDSLLRFLSRLSAFGLAAGEDPLLKPLKPGS